MARNDKRIEPFRRIEPSDDISMPYWGPVALGRWPEPLAICAGMSRTEAASILSECLRRYRCRSYEELASLVSQGRLEVGEVAVSAGGKYQFEVQFVWDDKPNAAVRVIASVDDGGVRALLPVTDSFIIGPDGRFVGE